MTADTTTGPTIARLNPPSLPDAGATGYSQITIAEPGRLAFISGQVAWPADGGPTPTDLGEQAALAMSNAAAALAAIGASPEHLVMTRAYLVDMTSERIGVVWPHLAAFLKGTQPSLTAIGVAALAAPDLQLEFEMIVRLP